MNEAINETNWPVFLREYSNRNQGRPTRFGVFEASDGSTNDYWIHDGVPLVAIDAYNKKGKIRVDLFFPHYTHPIDGVARIVDIGDGADHGLDILDLEGRTAIQRFEDWATKKEN